MSVRGLGRGSWGADLRWSATTLTWPDYFCDCIVTLIYFMLALAATVSRVERFDGLPSCKRSLKVVTDASRSCRVYGVEFRHGSSFLVRADEVPSTEEEAAEILYDGRVLSSDEVPRACPLVPPPTALHDTDIE